MAWDVKCSAETAPGKRTPYVDWFVEVETAIRPNDTTGFRQLQDLILLPDAAANRLFGSGLKELAARLLAEGYDSGREVPIPVYARDDSDAPSATADWLPAPEDLGDFIFDLPGEDEDLVIVGIIDEGIALGNSRFRKADGTTRFLHNWQQGGIWREATDAYALPYGRDMFQKEINTKLAQNSGPSGLDEEAFNRSIGITDYINPTASRTVDRRASHGTHILDLAAGMECDDADADRLRILSVTLPPRPIVGLAGTFLAYFAIQGMLRLVDLADHISEVKHHGARGAIPIVVNMSYGQQAGPKDGQALFERIIKALNEYRAQKGYLPVRLIMPAGNDNLRRCRARWKVGRKPIRLPWQILPEDQSSNFVEVWTEPVYRESKTGDIPTARSPVKFLLTLPDGQELEIGPAAPNCFYEISDAKKHVHARIYTRIVPVNQDEGTYRYNHVICVAPTLLHDAADWVAAPAGRWLLEIFNVEKKHINVFVHVQVDQAARPDEVTSGRSYFDHPNYVTHDHNGRVRDTYRYPLTGNAKKDHNEPANKYGPVQRKGTHNSIATYSEILVIGGYRESDGRPAPYSSSTQRNRSVAPGRKLLTCAMPSETAPHHWGQLGAGTRSGSTVALSGTSFATAHMTRYIITELLACGCPETVGSNAWAERRARMADSDGEGLALKVGSGRLPSPKRPLNRLETSYQR